MNVSGRAGLGAGQLDLLDNLACGPAFCGAGDAAGEQAGPELPAFFVPGAPPGEQARKTLLLLPHRPVKLRGQEIAPAFLKPQARVGVQLLVRVQASNALWVARP